jgi:hypothetical protein
VLADYQPYFTKDYNLSGFDPAGCQATLTIRRGQSTNSKFKLAGRYLFFKFLKPQLMKEFLASVTQVECQESPSLLALNCRQK